jgi:phospholipase/lecithinase/hemolysin
MRLKSLLLAATLVASSTSAFAAPFTKLIVFGDSTSDNGNLAALSGGALPAPPYTPGHASNGPVAVEYLSLALGLGPLLPAAVGGTNFAVIGAATGNVPIPGGGGATADNIGQVLGFALPPTGMSTAQLARYFQLNATTDPNALFVIWGGPNDLGINPDAAVAIQAAQNIGMMIDTLYGAGARNFLVPNMADLGLTPGNAGSPGASLLTSVFNTALAGQLAARSGRQGISLTAFDTFSLFNAVVGSPETYGFTNVEDECYQGPLLGIGGTGPVCQTPGSYLFWDQTHPTTAAHALLGAGFADAVQPRAVPEPATMLLTAVGVAALAVRRRRAA